MSRVATLIMAAGESSRFGGCKQLTRVNGQSLLQQSIDQAHAFCPGQVFVVSGAWQQEISAALESGNLKNAHFLYHPDWAQGLGSSIAHGVTALSEVVDSLLIVLADQIAVTTEDFFGLYGQFTGENIVCGLYAGRRGVPALFGRNNFWKLQTLHGDQGAKALLYDQQFHVVEYPLEHASIDIDTPEDLRMWINENKKKSTNI